MTRYGVIDVGTNSVKFLLEEDGKSVVDRSEITRLGQGAGDDGRLVRESIERTVDAIDAMAEEAGDAKIVAVGTAGLRRAPNRDELIDAVRDRTGIEVEVISGEDEARLSYLATKSALGLEGSVTVFEIVCHAWAPPVSGTVSGPLTSTPPTSTWKRPPTPDEATRTRSVYGPVPAPGLAQQYSSHSVAFASMTS